MKKNKYAIIIFMLLGVFLLVKDRLISLDTNLFLAITISFITLALFMVYLKFREDKKQGTIDYRRIIIGAVFMTLSISYGIYIYLSF